MRLHTPTSVFVAINGRWLEAAQQIQWQETITRRPLYGVLSTRFRDLSHGRLNVSGTLGIYFDSLGSFKSILMEAWDRQLEFRDRVDNDIERRARLASEQITDVLDPVAKLQILTELQQAVFTTSDNDKRKVARRAIEILNNQFIPNNLPKINPGALFSNPLDVDTITQIRGVRLDITYEKRLTHSYANDRQISTSAKNVGESFEDVRFISKTKGFANGPKEGGQPVMEFYQFVARDVTHQE